MMCCCQCARQCSKFSLFFSLWPWPHWPSFCSRKISLSLPPQGPQTGYFLPPALFTASLVWTWLLILCERTFGMYLPACLLLEYLPSVPSCKLQGGIITFRRFTYNFPPVHREKMKRFKLTNLSQTIFFFCLFDPGLKLLPWVQVAL